MVWQGEIGKVRDRRCLDRRTVGPTPGVWGFALCRLTLTFGHVMLPAFVPLVDVNVVDLRGCLKQKSRSWSDNKSVALIW